MRSARTIAILAGVVFLALCLGGHSAGKAAPAPVKRLEQAKDPHKDSVILVEAFMVQVQLSELYDLGAPAISEGSKSVSVDHILKCLKERDAGAVTAGAKVAVGQGDRAKTDSIVRQGFYVGPLKQRKLEYMDLGTSLMAVAEIQREGRIFLELDFKHSGLEESHADDDIGPTVVERTWSSRLFLDPGDPTLVGATQGQETVVFLIVTANIKK